MSPLPYTLDPAMREELAEAHRSLNAAIRREQKLRELIEAMLDDEDVPDDYGRGRREGWNVALTAVLNMISEETQ